MMTHDDESRAALGQFGLEPLRLSLAELLEPVDLRDRLVNQCAAVPSPVGELVVCWNQLGVSWVRMLSPDDEVVAAARKAGRPAQRVEQAPGWLRDALDAVGSSSGVPRVPVDMVSVSPFQRAVLHAAQSIPRGQTRPYGWIAQEVGSPKAVRAVGTALARNPVPLLVPCHRVVKSDGSIGQYVFGTPVKQRLLQWEGAQPG